MITGLLALLVVSIMVGVAGVAMQWKATRLQAAIAKKKQQQSDENYASARLAIDRLTDLSIELSTVPGTDGIREDALREVLAFYLKNIEQSDDPDSACQAAETLIRIAAIRAELHNFDEAIDDLTSAREILNEPVVTLSGQLRYRDLLAKSYFKSGVYQRALGRFDQAIASHLRAAAIYEQSARETGNQEYLIHQAAALNNAAPMVAGGGDIDRALELSDQALDLHEKIEQSTIDDLPLLLVNRAIGLEIRAALLKNQGELELSIEFLQRAADDLENAVRQGLNRPADIEYVARVHRSLTATQVLLGKGPDVWSVHSQRSSEILWDRWKARPDRPAVGADYTIVAWRWAQYLWFSGKRQRSRQIYRNIIATLEDLNTRFPDFRQGAASNSSIVAYRLVLLWASCPDAQLRDPESALELARTMLRNHPDDFIARSGAVIAESLYGDTAIAEELLAGESHLDNSRSPETVKRVVQLAIQHRRDGNLAEADLKFLDERRNSHLDHAGVVRHLAETLIQLNADAD